jgi:hypothetical protein
MISLSKRLDSQSVFGLFSLVKASFKTLMPVHKTCIFSSFDLALGNLPVKVDVHDLSNRVCKRIGKWSVQTNRLPRDNFASFINLRLSNDATPGAETTMAYLSFTGK